MSAAGQSYYARLGIEPTATQAEVRAAYRRQARVHHPDARGSAARMAEVNEAWHVLGHPHRRREYDRRLGVGSIPSEPAPERVPEPPRPPIVAPGPVRFPWRLMAVMAAVGVAIVLVGAVTFEPGQAPPADRLLTAGSCVVIQPNGDAAEVTCAEPHDAVVVTLVAFDGSCPFGTDPHRDQQGLGLACVRRP